MAKLFTNQDVERARKDHQDEVLTCAFDVIKWIVVAFVIIWVIVRLI